MTHLIVVLESQIETWPDDKFDPDCVHLSIFWDNAISKLANIKQENTICVPNFVWIVLKWQVNIEFSFEWLSCLEHIHIGSGSGVSDY